MAATDGSAASAFACAAVIVAENPLTVLKPCKFRAPSARAVLSSGVWSDRKALMRADDARPLAMRRSVC
jgi:hypothetical protein